MQKQYKRITDEERDKIADLLAKGHSQNSIAEKLQRSPSSISRELSRNSRVVNGYGAVYASRLSHRRRASCRKGKSKLSGNDRLNEYVTNKLNKLWSPEEIAKRIKMDYPQDKNMRISSEAIYQYLYIQPSKELRRLLRHGHLRRHKQGRPKKSDNRGKIPNMTMIDERPEEVVSRLVPGHWEGDIIKGKYNKSALGTLVERRTRYTILVPLPGFDSESVRKAFARALTDLPEHMRRTLTYDQGKEMSDHIEFTISTDIQVYFAHEGSPWERGTNENTNGLIRQFFPKGTDFTKVTNEQVDHAQALLNDRPRKVLGYLKPNEVLSKVLR